MWGVGAAFSSPQVHRQIIGGALLQNGVYGTVDGGQGTARRFLTAKKTARIKVLRQSFRDSLGRIGSRQAQSQTRGSSRKGGAIGFSEAD
jgi:hypothetical protein